MACNIDLILDLGNDAHEICISDMKRVRIDWVADFKLIIVS